MYRIYKVVWELYREIQTKGVGSIEDWPRVQGVSVKLSFQWQEHYQQKKQESNLSGQGDQISLMIYGKYEYKMLSFSLYKGEYPVHRVWHHCKVFLTCE